MYCEKWQTYSSLKLWCGWVDVGARVAFDVGEALDFLKLILTFMALF
jgi:hypothetical protein